MGSEMCIRDSPNTSLLVIGHADPSGTDIENYAISQARARSVVNYLASLGIEPARLASRAVGATDLLTTGTDSDSRNINRRVEFVIYGLLLPS